MSNVTDTLNEDDNIVVKLQPEFDYMAYGGNGWELFAVVDGHAIFRRLRQKSSGPTQEQWNV